MTTPAEVLEFWLGEPATTPDQLGAKMKRWYQGGPAVDAEIRARFADAVATAIDGGFAEWEETPRDRLALIILLDQFPRSVYRDDPRAFAGDSRAQWLALDALDRGLDAGFSVEEHLFLHMPLLHAEDLATQERGVIEADRTVEMAAPALKPFFAMGKEQSRKYRDVIARFGRFTHRNQVLGRTSTPEELAFLETWTQKAPPKTPAT